MKKILHHGLFPMLVLTILACTDNLNKTINDQFVYHPEYSLPIGSANYTLGQILPRSALGQPIDTTGLPDTLHWISYNDNLYPDPFGHEAYFYLQYNFSQLSNQFNYVKTLMFRVNYTNEFPTYSDLQIYFLNGNMGILDSLFDDGLYRMNPAEIDKEGMVVAPFISQKDTYLDSIKIAHLINSSSLELYIYVATNRSGQKAVHFNSDSSLYLQFAVRASVEIPVGN